MIDHRTPDANESSASTLRNAPQTFLAMIAIGVLAVVLDVAWRRARGGFPNAAVE